ncbi:MAG: leucine-rich repeat domain-containing protein [Treponema sp.]|jgi:hypothetical protein|nr:leucine-rich repeat domain-containing protein [Treponema sp.]
MKNTNKLFGRAVIAVITLTALFAVSTTACSKSGGGGGKSLNSATELKEYLDKQPANGPDKPIKVAMKANEMMLEKIAEVISEAGKYVSLDLSGSPLTTIPEEAFSGCKTLVGVIIPKGVTSIETRAFRGTSLTSVTIPNGVTSIGELAFAGCSDLASVTIPDSVTSIEDGAFQDCTGLTSITIPNSVTSIGDDAFRGTGLTSVTIPNSVTSIGESAFAYCSGLTSIIIPNSVTSIEDNAFRETGLTSVTFHGTITSANFSNRFPFGGDLRTKYLAGGIGTYKTTNPGYNAVWTKQ